MLVKQPSSYSVRIHSHKYVHWHTIGNIARTIYNINVSVCVCVPCVRIFAIVSNLWLAHYSKRILIALTTSIDFDFGQKPSKFWREFHIKRRDYPSMSSNIQIERWKLLLAIHRNALSLSLSPSFRIMLSSSSFLFCFVLIEKLFFAF